MDPFHGGRLLLFVLFVDVGLVSLNAGVSEEVAEVGRHGHLTARVSLVLCAQVRNHFLLRLNRLRHCTRHNPISNLKI